MRRTRGALAAGLSGAVAASRLVVTAGLAEIAAGSIAMGLGGYLAARGDAEHYASALRRERQEVVEQPEAELAEVREVFERFGLTQEERERVARALSARPEAWVEFMMRFELGLEAPDPGRALRSAVTIERNPAMPRVPGRPKVDAVSHRRWRLAPTAGAARGGAARR